MSQTPSRLPPGSPGRVGDQTRTRTQTVIEAAHLVVCEHGHCRLGVVEASVAVALERLFLDVWQESLGSGRSVGIVRGLAWLCW